ncbi:MAG: hypothetical protein AAF547_02880 [Actinomycetota bacterium]
MRLLNLVKYTSEASAEVLKEGFGSRRDALAAAVEQTGGEIEHFWAVNSSDWNVAFVVQTTQVADDAQGAAVYVAYQAAGYIEKVMSLPIAEAADADAVLQAMADTRARTPGATD